MEQSTDLAGYFLRLRNELGLSQEEFGEALQMPRSTLANYETGRTEWRRIHRTVAIPLLREYVEARYKRHVARLEKAQEEKR